MNKTLFLILLVMGFLTSSGQKNYIPGYVVKLNGDTIQGMIDYQNWRINPVEITFIEADSSVPVDYRPTQIKGFRVNDKIYEGAVVQVETSPNDDQHLIYDDSFIYRTDSVFLNVRFRGSKSLYHCVTNDWKDQFYILTDSSVELLLYKKYLVEADNYSQVYKAENKKYKAQLSSYLQNCPTVDYEIEHSLYNIKSLDNVFLAYARCTGKNYEYIRKKDERRTEVGFMAGMTMTKVNFSGRDYPYLLNVNYSISNNFTAGVFFDYIQVKNNRRLSLSNELILTGFKLEEQYDVYEDEKNYTITNVDIRLIYLKWHLLGRYKFPVGKNLFLYGNAGPSLGVCSVLENQIVNNIKIAGYDRTTTDIAIDYTSFFELGFVGGIGIRLKDFSLESRYEWGDGFSGDPDLTARTQRIYFLLGYWL